MEFKKIAFEVSENEVIKVKNFIIALSDIRNSISVKKTEGPSNTNISFYTFTVEEDVIKDFFAKYSGSGLKMVSQEEIYSKLQSTIKSNAAYNSAISSDISPADIIAIKKVKKIEDFIEEGNYSVLVDITKDIRVEQNKRKRAEAAIPATVKKAIELNFTDGLLGKRRAFTALENLVNIATNTQLKNLRLNHILENAGSKAIELSTKYDDFADELIKIGNNIKIPNLISIKSIVKFAEITLRDDRNFKYEYEADIVYATKNTNLRWLRIAYDSVGSVLTSDEQKQFQKFMSFIEFKKLAN
ncbi:MAG: hypothetical protein PF445_13390 [Melioribacteraceae bacterium]|jgi:hypothetical protein|nr:hypothetical protein [Melioribacteraceae bacterium]